MSDWQDIGTAPLDGTRVRLRGDGWEKVGRWFTVHDQALYDGPPEDRYSPYWIADDGEEYLEPTHWQSLGLAGEIAADE